MAEFGTTDDGRLFRGLRGGPLSESVYTRVWAKARRATFKPKQAAARLAEVSYDLRHAAVSTWLNGGITPQQVAEWAGHSPAVLLRIYAKCLDGDEQAARRRITAALGEPDADDEGQADG